jgi:hypothetical protein
MHWQRSRGCQLAARGMRAMWWPPAACQPDLAVARVARGRMGGNALLQLRLGRPLGQLQGGRDVGQDLGAGAWRGAAGRAACGLSESQRWRRAAFGGARR